jgi:hypothetical protein
MKPIWCILFVGPLLTTLAVVTHGQGFSIDWFTVDGGGRASTNSAYSITGTIGQSDANVTMTNANYSLTGGFWSLTAVQTEGAPALSIARTSTNTLIVFWSSVSSGWSLQQNTELTSTNWTTVPESITDNGTSKFIIARPAAGNRFYRLFRP